MLFQIAAIFNDGMKGFLTREGDWHYSQTYAQTFTALDGHKKAIEKSSDRTISMLYILDHTNTVNAIYKHGAPQKLDAGFAWPPESYR